MKKNLLLFVDFIKDIEIKHLIRIMRLSVFLILVGILSTHATISNSQNIRITIAEKSISLDKLINEIEQQTNYLFVYGENDIDLQQKVKVDARNKPISEVLDKTLRNLGITYEFSKNYISLRRVDTDKTSLTGPQQTRKVSGVITDMNGEPIIGANILVKGTVQGTTTDLDGNYTLEVPSNAVLQFSYIGYLTQEVTVKDKAIINVSMKEDTKSLEEVVVIGYGTVKKSNLTGAITQVKADDLPQAGNMSLGQMLTGKAAGMQVSLQSAQPGGGVWMQIRGNASGGAGNSGPLYVIDGFPISTENMEPGSGNRYESGSKSPLNNLNPADIASIEILKDASATAIYGARAANGVVLITTKRGKQGEKPKVQYSGSVSFQKRVKQIDMLDAQGFMTETNRVLYEDYLSENKLGVYGNTDPSAVAPFSPKYSNDQIANAQTTDWLGAVERNGVITQHNLSLTGGTDKTSYYISGNYYDHQGVVKNNGIQRYSGRANFDQKLGKYIKTGINFNVSQVKSDNVALGSGQNENAGVIRAAMNANPSLPIYDDEGNYTLDPDQPYLANAVSLLDMTDESTVNQLLGNFYLIVTPFEGLDLKMNAGFQQEKGERNTYVPKTTLYGQKAGGEASKSYSNRSSKLFDLTASYTKTFNEIHNFSAMAGYSYQHFNSNGFNAGNSRFITDAFKWNNLAAGENTKPSVGSFDNEEVLGSVFARLNYNYADRYLISATMRGDASSKFAENHKWGYFPSVALAWRMINEQFMSEQQIVSDLKWRVSLGQTGNSNIGNNALALYSTGDNYNFGDQQSVGVAQSQLANPNLKWETTTELNVGLDFGFLQNRITGSMEFFTRRVDDLLDKKELMQYNPISSVMANIGAKGSKGFELGITSRNLIGEFSWSTDVVFSLYRDRWLERNPQWKKAIYENEKDMLNSYYLYISDGLVQPGDMNPDGTCKLPHMPNAKPGMIKYKDLNGRDEDGNLVEGPDGKLDDADVIYLGTKTSKFYLGFGNTFAYKGFDLNIFFYGYFGRQLENPAYDWYLKRSWFLKNGVNMATAVRDRWAHDNQTGKYPTSIMNPYDRSSDFWLENANFLRCKNITLGYTLPKIKNLDKVIQNLRVYGDVQNPFVITKYSGVDPEMDGMAAYPTQLTVSFGVDITF
ncbi:TonB-dependent receptor [Parabacteroides chongii]|uniref:TonB-dependent receptor n=1 Tax=Parabacteroides chongii TaxID=2685834 RepID=UPI00240D4712|nr:TonB-dependent receptor [Parabacteroides chongii]WFE85978.1 TonB-dependent receptor [Parabacteroides chongii]